ncbi:hypothetical protein OG474_08200 [Kribbella sp. NBC_01505]|uniref:hypothetical protein n=1 Tax=Kribbella sp. NBC_01505 TaxID=2903580 RepID=UPI0038672A07
MTVRRTWLIDQLDARPTMVGVDGTFAAYSAFFRGWQYGGGAEWLQSFQGWLADGMDTGWNLGWEGLILRLALPDRPGTWSVSAERSREDEAVVRPVWKMRGSPLNSLVLPSIFDQRRAHLKGYPVK